MLLFSRACVFFWRFVLWRNYKVQVIAHVGRKSAVVLSGIMEASYSRFFVGRGFDCSDFLGRLFLVIVEFHSQLTTCSHACFFFRNRPLEELPHRSCRALRGEVDSSIPDFEEFGKREKSRLF